MNQQIQQQIENIDVEIFGEKVPELPHEYFDEFYTAKPGPISLVSSNKEMFYVIFKLTRNDSELPVYVIDNIITQSQLGDIIKHPPKLVILSDVIRNDITNISLIIRNKSYVMSKIMTGDTYHHYPVLSTMSSDSLNAVYHVDNAENIKDKEKIANRFFSNKKKKSDWLAYTDNEFTLSRMYDEMEDAIEKSRMERGKENE